MSYLRIKFEESLRQIKKDLKIIPVGIFCFLTLFYLVYIGNMMLAGHGNIVVDSLALVVYILLIYPLLSLVYGKNNKEYFKFIRTALNSITVIFFVIMLAIKYTKILVIIGLSSVLTGESDEWLLFAVVGMCIAIFTYLSWRLFLARRDINLF